MIHTVGIYSNVTLLNNDIKSLCEISSNIFSETQYDSQCISIEITNEIKNEIASPLGCKHKVLYNKSSNMKKGESEAGIKMLKKNYNQIYYQQNKKKS